jgi:hypothetical protein
LQGIWNEVYKGSVKDGRKKIKHMVEPGGAVHNVVCQSVIFSFTTSINYPQAIQRLTEWCNSVGSNGLTIVGDFMDTTGLDTTEACQEAAEQLLEENRYVYVKTRDVIEDQEVVVCKQTITVCLHA